jgi:SNF2 family DNA or RNA helicase
LDKGARLGRFIGNYRREYFQPDKRNQQIVFSYKPKENAETAIYEKISDICMSMKACDYLKMPERIDNMIEVELSEKEKALYKQLEKEMLLPFAGGDIDAVNAAALSNKLLQMASGAVYDENKAVKIIHNKKLEALEDLIEAANGKPVLIFYGYQHDRDRILKTYQANELKTSADITKWNNGETPIALVHPAAAGHGLNLQAGGSTVIWFSLTWSLELYQQANARLWRQGQKETVVVNHIISKGTIDEQVMTALAKKKDVQAALLHAVRVSIKGDVA